MRHFPGWRLNLSRVLSVREAYHEVGCARDNSPRPRKGGPPRTSTMPIPTCIDGRIASRSDCSADARKQPTSRRKRCARAYSHWRAGSAASTAPKPGSHGSRATSALDLLRRRRTASRHAASRPTESTLPDGDRGRPPTGAPLAFPAVNARSCCCGSSPTSPKPRSQPALGCSVGTVKSQGVARPRGPAHDAHRRGQLMFENLDDPVPPRPAPVDGVMSRGHRLRMQRRMVAGAAVLFVLAGTIAGAAALQGESHRKVLVENPPTTTTVETATTVVQGTTSTTAAGSTTSTTVAARRGPDVDDALHDAARARPERPLDGDGDVPGAPALSDCRRDQGDHLPPSRTRARGTSTSRRSATGRPCGPNGEGGVGSVHGRDLAAAGSGPRYRRTARELHTARHDAQSR